MTETSGIGGHSSDGVAVCAVCGVEVELMLAPRVLVSSQESWVFCGDAHAEEFQSRLAASARGISLPKAGERKAQKESVRSAEPRSLSTAAEPSAKEPSAEEPLALGTSDLEPSLGLDDAHSLPFQEESSGEADGVATQSLATPEGAVNSGVPAEAWGRKLVEWCPTTLAVGASLSALISGESFWEPLSIAFVLGGKQWTGQTLLTDFDRKVGREGESIDALLKAPARVPSGGEERFRDPDSLRAGEEFEVREGERVSADGIVAEGEAELSGPFDSRSLDRAESGFRVMAGSLVKSGSLRVVCSKPGSERVLSRHQPELMARAIREFSSIGLARKASFFAAPVIGASVAWLLALQGESPTLVWAVFAAVWGALSHFNLLAAVEDVSYLWLSEGLRRGFVFSSATVVERLAKVHSLVFCARGTLLHGSPEVTEVHPLRDSSREEVLGLAAGAESVVPHPIATALARAATERDISAELCRGHNVVAGLGVVCSAADGSSLVVGSRELLLRERISIAVAEESLRSLESRGLTALLVAKSDRLMGVIGLSDNLRAGARATVQQLLDSGVEPVLLSGDSRTTTEAVAGVLAIEHVRPEVAAVDRAAEVASLREAGNVVAVVGNSPRDDAALAAAEVPMLLEGATLCRDDSPHPQERGVGLVEGKVLVAALSIRMSRLLVEYQKRILFGAWILPALAAIAVALRLSPPISVAVLGALSTVTLLILTRRLSFPGTK